MAGFPKTARLLRSQDFRKVYDHGEKFAGPLFAAFCLRRAPDGATAAASPSRIGFTTPRALGKAVVRNRIRRRIREAVRAVLKNFPPGWDVVINPRRRVSDAPFSDVLREVEKLLARCAR